MPNYNILLLAALLVSLAVQVAGAKVVFVAPRVIPPGMRLIGVAFVFCGMLQVGVLSHVVVSRTGTIAGLLLYAWAMVLFLITCGANRHRPLSVAYSTDVPEHLVSWGPYRYVRHPFYAAYCVTWLAGVVATGSLLMLATFLLMLSLYARAAAFEERKFLRSRQAFRYQEYRRSTGMLFPALWRGFTRSANRQSHTGSPAQH